MSFEKVITLDQLPENQIVCLKAKKVDLVLIRRGDQIYALENQCSHADVSFDDGELDGNQLVCPMHGAAFDITSGRATRMPATSSIETYDVRINGEDVEVDLD